jgi:flagellar hook-length control protein FliK
MANLMIARPQAPNAEAPSVNPKVLPADVKTAGKTAAQVKEEAKSSAQDFETNLKDGLSKEAKKDEASKEAAKKQAAAAALLAASQQGQTQVQPKAVDPKTVDAKTADGKGDAKGLDEKSAVKGSSVKGSSVKGEAISSVMVNGKLVDAKTLAAEKIQGKGEQVASQSTPQTVAKNNLSPLQQVMLQQTKVTPEKGATAAAGLALPQALQAAGQPELEHDFEIESLDVKSGVTSAKTPDFLGKDELATKRTPASKVSTSDYLNLRDLTKPNLNNSAATGSSLELGTAIKGKDGKKDKLESLAGREAFTGAMANRLESGHQGKVIDAPVTQGSQGKNVLTHDAIHQMTQQVNMMNKAQQDGEIKIRLRPDHLGELSMSVKSQGQQVSIEIKTQNGESKKIIEESLASLKDSLAQQNLTLARVDVVTGPSSMTSAADQGMQMDMSQFRQNSGQNSERGFDQGNRGQDRLYEEMNAPVNLNTVRRASQASARGGQGLDLIA